ncbi:histidinol-phosphatase HisJ [Radiobacillus sp. PE A8.2]|uniref:histidinol-phosphatase HisJ n=1 Tax=Radiobacillus sp. PE A8.2 TaxID=3380349 RepID=UPI003890D934
MHLVGDFHIHSNYCPHGTNDQMETYVQAAISQGLVYLTFTEHAPLPGGFEDPTPDRDSAMSLTDVESYIKEINRLKDKYNNKITIYVGFEMDYIEGFESETRAFLDQWGPLIDDAILSVHMVKAPNGEYVCVDFSEQEFARIIELFSSVDEVYASYYRTVDQAIQANLGIYKPKRIGHLTLIEKFSLKYPATQSFNAEIIKILDAMKAKELELDLNTAGFYKELCQTSYPSQTVIELAQSRNIPFVFGSDSHTAEHVARGLDLLPKAVQLNLPQGLTTQLERY